MRWSIRKSKNNVTYFKTSEQKPFIEIPRRSATASLSESSLRSLLLEFDSAQDDTEGGREKRMREAIFGGCLEKNVGAFAPRRDMFGYFLKEKSVFF